MLTNQNKRIIKQRALDTFTKKFAQMLNDAPEDAHRWVQTLAQDVLTLTYDKMPDRLGNFEAQEGCDRCFCGCKYWENDKCVDCGTHINEVRNAELMDMKAAAALNAER